MPTLQRRTALITGASAGIGAAFAREAAARGFDLILSARRVEPMQQLAHALRARYGAESTIFEADLGEPGAVPSLLARIAGAGLRVDMLVNNAGYGVTGVFNEQPWETHERFLRVLLMAPTELCHRLLPGMSERRFGRVINVASLAGMVPAPAGHTLYAATKSFLVKFSQALAQEHKGSNVHVTALCPGFTHSEFHDANGTREMVSKMPKWMWMDAESVAREGFDAVTRGDAIRINGRVNRVIYAFTKHIPDRAAQAIVAKRAKDFRKTGEPSSLPVPAPPSTPPEAG